MSSSPRALLGAVFATFFFLLLTPPSSGSSDRKIHGSKDPCSSPKIELRPIKPSEEVAEESYYVCHPTQANGFVRCVVGRPAERLSGRIETTQVIDEHEKVCDPGLFFNSAMRACVAQPLSDCAIGFYDPSAEQRLCESFRMTRPLDSLAVADLICHDKEKHLFVVCPINLAQATVMKCVNGTFFNQFLGRCVANEDQSDCPIDWREMEIENGLKAGRMTKTGAVSPQRRCICDSLLAQKPDADSVYAADPEVDEKFMVCVRINSVIHEGKCPAPLLWDDDAVACNTKSVRHPVPACSSGSRTTAVTKPVVTKPVVTKPVVILPGGGSDDGAQHDCIDCGITERQRCECRVALAAAGEEVVYICDPDSEFSFLVCTKDGRVVCQDCALGTKWNVHSQACGQVRQCADYDKDGICSPTTTAAPTTTVAPTTTAAPTKAPAMTAAPTIATPVPDCEIFYEFHPEKLNWYSAKRVCEVYGGSLLTIPDSLTQNQLRARFGSASTSARMWIGATDSAREGLWQWVTGESFGYTNWYRGQPSGDKQNCLLFNYEDAGAWADEDCSLNKPFMCQGLVCS